MRKLTVEIGELQVFNEKPKKKRQKKRQGEGELEDSGDFMNGGMGLNKNN